MGSGASLALQAVTGGGGYSGNFQHVTGKKLTCNALSLQEDDCTSALWVWDSGNYRRHRISIAQTRKTALTPRLYRR